MGDKAVGDASSLSQRTVVKWAALYLPVHWPTGVLVTRPEIEQGSGGTRPGDFGRDVADLVAAMERFASANDTVDWPAHPIFGPLTRRGGCVGVICTWTITCGSSVPRNRRLR